MLEHFLSFVCEGRRKPSLLGLPLNLRPLGFFYSLFDAVGAWTRPVLLWDDPGGSCLGLRFDNVR